LRISVHFLSKTSNFLSNSRHPTSQISQAPSSLFLPSRTEHRVEIADAVGRKGKKGNYRLPARKQMKRNGYWWRLPVIVSRPGKSNTRSSSKPGTTDRDQMNSFQC
jgi:hypothetical protein